jgi:hypothetical protein
MVIAMLEVHKEIGGLWQKRTSSGMKEFPNYGQHIPKDFFKAFLYGYPHRWGEKKYWDNNHTELSFNSLV